MANDVALITGASQGLGLALAGALADRALLLAQEMIRAQ